MKRQSIPGVFSSEKQNQLPPLTPTVTGVTVVSSTQVSVSVASPSYSAVPTTFLIYESSTNTQIGSGSTSPITGTYAFAQGTSYTFYAKSQNSFGTSGASSNSSSVTPYGLPTQYVVTYDATTNGGAVNPTSVAVTAGSSTTLLTPTHSAGYTFSGWYTAASGGTLVGAAGASYTPSGFNANITLYAQWTANSYTLTYNATSGVVSPTSASYTTGSSLTLPTPTYTNYTFAGWYSASSGGTFIGNGGASYSPPIGGLTIYAQWNSYVVSYDATTNGGAVTPTSVAVTAGGSTTLPTPTHSAGYTFSGWYTASSGGTLAGAAGATYTPIGSNLNITLYAQWTANSYTLTYNVSNGGTVSPTTVSYTTGSSVTLATPTYTNFTFNGWYSNLLGGTLIGTAGSTYYPPVGGVTIYAQWTPITFAAEYLIVAGGGGGSYSGGGGGAGGFINSTNGLYQGTSYAVSVGTGGAGGTSGSKNGGTGNDSSFAGVTASGGGSGTGSGTGGGSGGSGGGAISGTGGTGVSGQGNNGGSSNAYGAGGGGGAGGTGNLATGPVATSTGGNGGSPVTNSITGSSVVYAGGGPGCGNSFVGSYTGSASGKAGTGGAAGNGANGTAGQNGVVIISLPNYTRTPSYTGSYAGGANVTATTYTSSGTTYKIYSFAAGSGTVTF